MKVFLPFIGEFGWYLMNHVKRIHADPAPDKIVCCKKGHECLFPTASQFYYDWADVADGYKAGIHDDASHEPALQQAITQHFQLDEVEWDTPTTHGWHDKHTYAAHTFKPKCLLPYELKADVVITPRFRQMDSLRNWPIENWQFVVDQLNLRNISVAVCGAEGSSYHLEGVKFNSWDYTDVDSDVELMNSAKLVITQESGLQYLAFLCEKPTFCIDHYHKDHGSDLHRPMQVPFKEVNYVWNKPQLLVQEIEFYLRWCKS